MIWINFPAYALAALVAWSLALAMNRLSRVRGNTLIANGLVGVGLAVMATFVVTLWLSLDRPPIRTLGETRLWYSIFLAGIGFVIYLRWRHKWFLEYSLGMAGLFLLVNLAHPETYDKTLMPALQSPWFVPHVVVYIFAYALLAGSSLVAIKGIWENRLGRFQPSTLALADNLVYVGFAFLTFGLLFGALWAKEAWGHYWTWDPKETWAFLTWIAYLLYIHHRHHKPAEHRLHLWLLGLSFVVLLVAWFGVNYLPTAQYSVHTYTN